jgi:hypothetical protein|tara:strand:+ start:202 stop:843 length:642 start_codon:yes stop_codon:yes gene_type:complete
LVIIEKRTEAQMNKLALIISLFILLGSCTATKNKIIQVEEGNTIENDFNQYLESIVNKEFEKSMEYVYPEFFDILTKEQMIKEMEQVSDNEEMEVEFENPEILNIGKSFEVEEQFYSKLKYSNMMNIKIFGEEEEIEEDKKARISSAKGLFEQIFGSKNVGYNSKTDFFEIYVEKEVIAKSKNGKSDWKFLVIEERQKLILEKFVPKKVLTME